MTKKMFLISLVFSMLTANLLLAQNQLSYNGKHFIQRNNSDLYIDENTSVEYITSKINELFQSGTPCHDIQAITYYGKRYHTVLIGNQCWMNENLNVGEMLNTGSSTQSDNEIMEKYCYDDIAVNCDTYGGIYTWGEAMKYTYNEGTQGICPSGWHIPTKNELIELASNINIFPPNENPFLNLMAGGHNFSSGWNLLGEYSFHWSSSEENSIEAYRLRFTESYSANINGTHKNQGVSVRCIRD